MEENPLGKIIDDAVDVTALVASDLKKRVVIETTKSYCKTILALGTALPVSIVLSGTPTISQERAREPEVPLYMPSEANGTSLPRVLGLYATTSASSSTSEGFIFKTFNRKPK